jgi:pyruvate dehydrogenase E1 component
MVRDENIGRFVAPIVPDEARTFGLEPLIAETKIYAPEGQRYTPVDSDLILRYAEDRKGQVLEEGITEAGAMGSFIALATSYATWGRPMLPIYLFYSMFGFQRTGDLAWLLGDIRGRGIMAGCTAGRTTLQGEGLQHDDGHSPVLAAVNPACRVYDPAFAYELAVLVEEAVKQTLGPDPADCFWYLTLYNENYVMPPMPEGEAGDEVRRGVLRGIYRFAEPAEPAEPAERAEPSGNGTRRRATLLFSGPMWHVAMEARELLRAEWGVSADAWSVTSYSELRKDALSVERWNRLHPGEQPRAPYLAQVLQNSEGPVVAVTDYVRSVPDQVARWVERPFTSLGTDGFGRSDTRSALRRFFEIDAAHLVVAVLSSLASSGAGKAEDVAQAIERYGLATDSADPWTP